MIHRIHVCTFGASRGLCGGVLAPLTDIAISGRRTRRDAAELLDPADDMTWSACTLEDVELEIGFLANLPGMPARTSPCQSCLGHVARMRATARPPIRHRDLGGIRAHCGRELAGGILITGRLPGLIVEPIDCPTCTLRAEQRDEKLRIAAIKQARAAERREAKQMASMRQKNNLDAADRAFAWLDEEPPDDLGVN